MSIKRVVACLVIIGMMIFPLASMDGFDSTYAAKKKIKASSSGIKDGVIDPKYGMYGNCKNGIPTVSIPVKIKSKPKKTKYYAIYMYDPDADNFCHWMAVNIKAKSTNIKANASKKNKPKMIQGKNDFGTNGYGGPTPPDKTHKYVIKVYALKSKVNLKKGFTVDEFKKAIKGKVLASTSIKGKYVK